MPKLKTKQQEKKIQKEIRLPLLCNDHRRGKAGSDYTKDSEAKRQTDREEKKKKKKKVTRHGNRTQVVWVVSALAKH
jgi:hypothetical protein